MVKIVLSATQSYEGVVCVQQRYTQCKLINECNHHISTSEGQNVIEIYKTDGENKLTLTLNGQYSDSQLSLSQVYSNAYDGGNTPLVLILNFGFKNRKLPGPKFCKYSEISSLINSNATKPISEISNYIENPNFLLKSILDENDKLSSILTYQLDVRSVDYNGKKIKVTNETATLPDFKRNGFVKYKHTPGDNFTNTKSCVMYNREILVNASKNSIEHIQGKKNLHVCVYFCSQFNDPLLLEFNDGATIQYYIQKKTGTALCWVKLTKNKCKELLSEDVENDEILCEFIANSHRKLINLLKTLVLLFKNTVTLVLDNQTPYGKDLVTRVLKDSDSNIYPNPDCIPSQPQSIVVKKETCPDLEKAGYVCYSSTFKVKASVDTGDLRILVPSARDLFSEIKLLKNDNDKAPTLLSYLKSQLTLYVFFYDRDPRPLLFYYNGTGYRPFTPLEYDHYWVKITDNFIFPCNANDSEKLVSILSKIVASLTTVELSFRPKNMAKSENEKPNSEGSQHESYIVQLISKAPCVKVTHCNKNCYRKYTHRPCGVDGKSDGYRLGLVNYHCANTTANVDYDIIKQLTAVDAYYNLYDHELSFPLLVVLHFKDDASEYYRLTSKDPKSKKWTKVENVDNGLELLKKMKSRDNVEGALYEIRNSLEIIFKSDQKQKPLFDPVNCKEDSISWVAIVASFGALGISCCLAAYSVYSIYKNPGRLQHLSGYILH
ncbi:hypothetical protein MACJ_000373 [Theileria orientalis]|uniref:Uncharacterized protein n=1 Tax=Theileria orientalis TaxID=68886 RepID=A0A976M3Z5_THEOR|nr:hypothetical protein MACJ_000373 [Theileria orientalis]